MTNHYPESQEYLTQEKPDCMLASDRSAMPMAGVAIANPQHSTTKTETAIIATPIGQLDTAALLDTGGKSAAIILCLAVFVFALSKYNESLLRGSHRNGGKK